MRRIVIAISVALSLTGCEMLEAGGEASREVQDPALPELGPNADACLREAVYFEAGNSDPAGRAAVAHTIINRVQDPRFPDTVCDVVKEGEDKGRCQFSYRCILDESKIRWPENMVRARETVEGVLARQVEDPTRGALFFHAAFMPPGWFNTLERIGNFGGNIFYRLPGQPG